MVNKLRLTGLASGMDTETTIKKLMQAEKMPLDRLKQQKQRLEWQRDSFREQNLALEAFKNQVFDGVMRESTFNRKIVTTSDDKSVTATALNATGNVSSTIEVTAIAEAKTWVSNKITKNGTADTVKKGDKINAVSFNGATPSTFTGTFDLEFKVQKPGEATYGETVKISVDTTSDTLETIAAKINSAKLGVSSFYDEQSGKFVLSNNATGAGSNIQTASSATEDFMKAVGFTLDGAKNLVGDAATSKAGADAQFKLNGVDLTRTTNSFTISGMNYQLKKPTTSPVSISSTTDVDSVYDAVVKFVDGYNGLVEKLAGKMNEGRVKGYDPLTDEQREALSDDQEKKWEELAKKGLLQGDSILRSTLSEMRFDLVQKVDNANISKGFSQLSELGITTSPNYTENGKLYINKDKLKEKIAENPQAVYQFFASNGTTEGEKGIARRLRESLDTSIKKIVTKAGNGLKAKDQFQIGKEIEQIDNRQKVLERRLEMVENRYYSRFGAMEKALQKANEQSAFLASRLG